MKINPEHTTLVIVGALNPVILTPPWVRQHGLALQAGEDFPVELQASLIGGQGPPRLKFDGINYTATSRNLTFLLAESSLEECAKATKCASLIFSELRHTPVQGVGFNFVFASEETPKPLVSLASNNGSLRDNFGEASEIVARRWANLVKWDDAVVTVEVELDNDGAKIKFNFHYTTESAEVASRILGPDDVYQKHLTKAEEVVKNLVSEG